MSKAAYIQNWEEWQRDFNFYVPIRVKFSDLDAFGHLNNVEVFRYLEHARIEYLKRVQILNFKHVEEIDKFSVVADVQCDFLHQVFYDEEIRVYVKVHHLGNTSLDIHYMGKNEKEQVVFTGRGVIVQIDKHTGKPYPWNDTQKTLIEELNRVNV